MKETEKTCSAVAEKWSMLWITPSPRWITSPAVVWLKWTTTEYVSQEAKCHFHSNLSVWMRTSYCVLSKLVGRWYKVTFMLLAPALLLPCIYIAEIYCFPVSTLPKKPWAAPVCMCILQPLKISPQKSRGGKEAVCPVHFFSCPEYSLSTPEKLP